MRTALLLMVHGSPRPESNHDVFRIMELVRARRAFDMVQEGFLECNEPSVADAVEKCVSSGAERVVAVPYFLHTGKHVAYDLPGILIEAQERFPQTEILMSSYVGRSTTVTKVLDRRAKEALRR